MRCPNCGAQNRPGVRFCEQCGVRVPDIAEAGRRVAKGLICPQCAFQNPSGLRFCEQCGEPLVSAKREEMQVCCSCGAQNPAELRFCEHCGASLIEPKPMPVAVTPAPVSDVAPPSARRRWIPWAAAVGAAVLVIAVLVVATMNYRRLLPPEGAEVVVTPSERDEAVNVAELIVEHQFPEYVGAERTVSVWEGGDGGSVYLVSYGIEADETRGIPFPRALNIYFDPETRQVSIEERN